jgi:hypothetical protein
MSEEPDTNDDVVMAGTGDWLTIDSDGEVTRAYNTDPPVTLRDFLACAISDDGVARWNDTKAAGRVLATAELEAIRKALREAAKRLRLVLDEALGEMGLPPSVRAWVMEADQ